MIIFVLLQYRTVENGQTTVETFENGKLITRLVNGEHVAIEDKKS